MRIDPWRSRLLGAAIGVGVDRLVGEPPSAWHPVAHFGRLMGEVERATYRDRRAAGVGYALVGLSVGLVAGRIVRSSALAVSLAVAGRALGRAAVAVAAALSVGDLVEARRRLPALVGRDPSALDESGVARAVVESVAENTVDAVVAPVLWACLAGAPGALGYRAVNTMDAMVAHRSVRYQNFGTASARLDDVANWVPARVTAALVALARPRATRAIAHAVRVQAPAHPSPNSGVAEAAFAAALGLSLGGPTAYDGRVEDRPILGAGRAPVAADVAAAVRLSADVSALLAIVLGALALGRVRS